MMSLLPRNLRLAVEPFWLNVESSECVARNENLSRGI